MTKEDFLEVVQYHLARPVDGLGTEDKAAVVEGCLAKPSSSWWSPEELGRWCMFGLIVLGLLSHLDWWLLSVIWTVAVSVFCLIYFLASAAVSEASASPPLTEDEFRSGVHHLLAQPVDDLSVKDKSEAIRASLVRQKVKPPRWLCAMRTLMGYFFQFA